MLIEEHKNTHHNLLNEEEMVSSDFNSFYQSMGAHTHTHTVTRACTHVRIAPSNCRSFVQHML